MTGCTVIDDPDVIEGSRYKSGGLVAVATVSIGWYMAGWRDFATGGSTIVAVCTVTDNALVVISSTRKCSRVMAQGTILRFGYWNMIL